MTRRDFWATFAGAASGLVVAGVVESCKPADDLPAEAPPARTRTCKNCGFWDPHKKECHRRSPIFVDHDSYTTTRRWVQTTKDEWCGEWVAAE